MTKAFTLSISIGQATLSSWKALYKFDLLLCVRVCVCEMQVSFRTSEHRQSFTVEVCVIDKNDNVPTFIEESMRGSVQLGLLKGTRTFSSEVTMFAKHFVVWVIFVSPTWNTTTYSVFSKQLKTCLMYPWKLQTTLNPCINRLWCGTLVHNLDYAKKDQPEWQHVLLD